MEAFLHLTLTRSGETLLMSLQEQRGGQEESIEAVNSRKYRRGTSATASEALATFC